MAQYRQSGIGNGLRNGVTSDHVSIGVRGSSRHFHHRRSKALPAYKISVGFCVLTLLFILCIPAFFYFVLQSKGVEIGRDQAQDDDTGINTDFLVNVTRIDKSRDLQFGHGSVAHGRDSHDWDKDDRIRDEDYNEEALEQARDDSVGNIHTPAAEGDNKPAIGKSYDILGHQGIGLYNEAGRNELKMYEAEYESSVKNAGESTDVLGKSNQISGDVDGGNHRALDDADEYDDGMDLQDDQMEEYDVGHDEKDHSGYTKPHTIDTWESSHAHHAGNNKQDIIEDADKVSNDYSEETLSNSQHSEAQRRSGHAVSDEGQPVRKLFPGRHSGSKKKSKRRKSSGTCEMKIMNSTALLVEPIESQKFARFSLQYKEKEEKEIDDENWEPRFAGHQSLREREVSFVARDQKINCGFVNGPEGSSSTGFDLAEDDAKYISSCHIAVSSCIFGNSDRLRSPMGKTVFNLVGQQTPSPTRSVAHLAVFPVEKGHEYAISNHYDRHCLWEEVAQNKRLNKYNHSVIDEQFAFYQADGMRRFNASDPNKLLPSNVPEGSFIIRAHTPMSNLFSCLWFNEVDRFTPRDQLSFAYTYHKLRRTNPGKPFYLNMFKDCERRKIAKLFRHRSEERRNS